MKSQELPVTEKSRGRPKGIKRPSSVVRLPDPILEAIGQWVKTRPETLTRAEAISLILRGFLKRHGYLEGYREEEDLD